MNRFLRGAGLVLAMTPLAYPCSNLFKAAEAGPLWALGMPLLVVDLTRLPGAATSPSRHPRG
jgi:hypothetical protein